jgi:acyl-CoA hydrolase
MTTASIDNLTFKRGAFLGDIVVLVARMTYVGRTSCEVRVDSYVEDKNGYRRAMNRAFLTYVAIDEKGKPLEIPYGLEVRTVEEKARWDGALLRKEYRNSRKDMGF